MTVRDGASRRSDRRRVRRTGQPSAGVDRGRGRRRGDASDCERHILTCTFCGAAFVIWRRIACASTAAATTTRARRRAWVVAFSIFEMSTRGRSNADLDYREIAIRLAQNRMESEALHDDVYAAKSQLCALMREVTTIRAQVRSAKAQRVEEEEKLRRAVVAASAEREPSGRRDAATAINNDRSHDAQFDVAAYMDVLRRHAELERQCA